MKKTDTLKVARFGLLTALTLVLSWLDSMFSSAVGLLPGIRLGLANTVLLFAIYTMTWEDCVFLMLIKVALPAFLFSSPSVMLYSLAGSSLSLLIMLLVKKSPRWGAMVSLCAAAVVFILIQTGDVSPAISKTLIVVLSIAACVAALAVWILIRTGKMSGVSGTSLAGAVAHNTGQILVASLVTSTPLLLEYYLPVLVVIGGIVGCITGIVAERVLAALRYHVFTSPASKESPHEDE